MLVDALAASARWASPFAAITLGRPFLFFLRNVRTGTPVLMGRFMGTARR